MNRPATLALRLTGAQPGELPAALWSFGYFFALLAGYYVLRPLRDAMAVQVGPQALQALFTAVFVAMLVLSPIFGWLTARIARRTLLPWLYGFFASNLLGFYVWHGAAPAADSWLPPVFFVWTSVFSLFAVSVFWSFMADVFDTGQARRLYGFISAGGTAGAVAGPLAVSSLVGLLGNRALFLISAVLIGVAIACLLGLRRWDRAADRAAGHDDAGDRPLGGSIWAGLRDVARSPYLLGICVFLFLFTLLSTFLYFQQVALVREAVPDGAARTRLFAQVDLAVNLLTLAIQVFAFGALARRAGTFVLLAAMPVLSIVGFAALALAPTLATLIVFGVLRRAGEYAISKPARETLFNRLPDEQKYKAKNVIDTVIYRGGDMCSGWIHAGLRGIGMSLTQIAWLAVPLAGAWLASAWYLARAELRPAPPRTAPPSR